MENESEVFEAKERAWAEHIQPLVEKIIDLADEHGIALLLTGVITDDNHSVGGVSTRGGLMAKGMLDIVLLTRGAQTMISDSLAD